MKKKDYDVKLPYFFEEHLIDFTPTEILVFIYLCKYAKSRPDGYIKASLTFIARRYDVSRQSVSTAVLGLVKKGWIGDIIHQDKDSNLYKINREPSPNIELLKVEQARRKTRSEIALKAKKERNGNGEFVGSQNIGLGGSQNASTQPSQNIPTQLTKELKEEPETKEKNTEPETTLKASSQSQTSEGVPSSSPDNPDSPLKEKDIDILPQKENEVNSVPKKEFGSALENEEEVKPNLAIVKEIKEKIEAPNPLLKADTKYQQDYLTRVGQTQFPSIEAKRYIEKIESSLAIGG